MKSIIKSEVVPLVDLVGQYVEIRGEIDAAISTVLEQASFIGGDPVRRFEDNFSKYLGVSHCIGVGNGTDAIEIVLEGLGLPAGSEVIVPAASFIASSEAVTRAGFRVVFADVLPDIYVLDPSDVARRITGRTSAILGVHLFGHPCPMEELSDIARSHGLALIEDAAQAHGSESGGGRVGGLGVAATFSFYPGKNLGAYGDAGAITTNDDALAHRTRMIANHGRISKYDHEFEGRNSRLDSLQAAVLDVKLRHLEVWTERRRALAARYAEGLAGIGGLQLPVERTGSRHVYHLYVVRLDRRDELASYLFERGISTGIHYPHSLPSLQAYAGHPQQGEAFFADEMARTVLSLPMADSIRGEQVDRVIDAVRNFFGA